MSGKSDQELPPANVYDFFNFLFMSKLVPDSFNQDLCKRILLLEDSLTDATMFKQMLSPDILLYHADSIHTAWDLLNQTHIDIIFLDIILPEGSGFGFLRQIKRHDRLKIIPVVMCSHKHDLSDKVWAEKLGAEDFIAKPIQEYILSGILKKLQL
jgi:PleD family two-component response regulator